MCASASPQHHQHLSATMKAISPATPENTHPGLCVSLPYKQAGTSPLCWGAWGRQRGQAQAEDAMWFFQGNSQGAEHQLQGASRHKPSFPRLWAPFGASSQPTAVPLGPGTSLLFWATTLRHEGLLCRKTTPKLGALLGSGCGSRVLAVPAPSKGCGCLLELPRLTPALRVPGGCSRAPALDVAAEGSKMEPGEAVRRHQTAIEKEEITGLKHSQKQIFDVNLPFEEKKKKKRKKKGVILRLHHPSPPAVPTPKTHTPSHTHTH